METREGTFVTAAGACRVVRSGEAYQGKQGLTYLRGHRRDGRVEGHLHDGTDSARRRPG